MTVRRMMLYIKKILHVAGRVILVAIGGVLIYALAFFAIDQIKNPNGLPMPFGFGVSMVLSGSMEPEISTDDLVFVKKPDELHVGDVVLYNTGGSHVIHRIVAVNGNLITTRGDANNKDDKPIFTNSVLGVYVGKIPMGGKVIKFATNPPFVMVTAFVLVVAALIWMFVEENHEQKKLDRLRAEVEQVKAENNELRKKL